MNLTLNIDSLGFEPSQQILDQQYDTRTTRRFKGTGTAFISMPGCLEVQQVRLPGLIHQADLIMDVPMDGSERPQYATFKTKAYRLINGIDGTPLLQRSRNCNDGIWQTGMDVYVTGKWDEEVSPPPNEPMVPPETIHQPVVLEVGMPEAAAATRGRTRAPAVAEPPAETKE